MHQPPPGIGVARVAQRHQRGHRSPPPGALARDHDAGRIEARREQEP